MSDQSQTPEKPEFANLVKNGLLQGGALGVLFYLIYEASPIFQSIASLIDKAGDCVR